MTETQPIIDLALAAAEPQKLEDGVAYSMVVPAEGTQYQFDTDARMDHPRRKTGHPIFVTAPSMGEYVVLHKSGATALYADVQQARLTAVLNGHDDTLAGWGDHRATLAMRKTEEWKRWLARNGEIGKQTDFAEHIEDCLADIVEPEGAVMLELAQHFQAATKVAFKQAARLANGQRQLVYEETVEAKAGQRGDITIPETFIIGVAPFEGSAAFRVNVRLRYRIGEGRLAIGYILDRPDKVMKAAFDDVLAEVAETTGLTPFLGTP
ncbi:MAG TPA: DUF2303 family protein [Acidimicrobiales bacterium]|nr:DUF2303 family protein [Acidimicrobiales bacterium]